MRLYAAFDSAASAWSQERDTEADEQENTEQSTLADTIQNMPIGDLRANFSGLMNDVVTSYGDNQ